MSSRVAVVEFKEKENIKESFENTLRLIGGIEI